MGWTAGPFEGTYTARAAITFSLGEEFAPRIVEAVCRGTAIYAAIRSTDGCDVAGLVLLTERRNGLLFTKPILENMGPAEDGCPARILDLLTPVDNEAARDWRRRCWDRLGRTRTQST